MILSQLALITGNFRKQPFAGIEFRDNGKLLLKLRQGFRQGGFIGVIIHFKTNFTAADRRQAEGIAVTEAGDLRRNPGGYAL